MISQTYADILTGHKLGYWFNGKKYDFRTLKHLTELGLLEMQVDYMRRVIWFKIYESKELLNWRRHQFGRGVAQKSHKAPYSALRVSERQKAYNLRRKAEKAA